MISVSTIAGLVFGIELSFAREGWPFSALFLHLGIIRISIVWVTEDEEDE
jgi:hypothetical protein